jgi:hypothetical protein
MRFLFMTIAVMFASQGYAAEVESEATTESKSQAQSGDNETKPATIPLDRIWAYGLPGTRDIDELAKGDDTKLLDSIVQSWKNRAKYLEHYDVPRPGFAASGCGLTALNAAHTVLVENTTPRDSFSPNEEITLVLFSELGTKQVQISEVRREGNRVVIQYRLMLPKWKGKAPANLALVPLGKLPVGEYSVEMEQIPWDRTDNEPGLKPIDDSWSRKYLSKPFSFTVEEGIIPLDRIWAYEMPGTRDIKSISDNKPLDQLDARLLGAALELAYYRSEDLNFKDVARSGFAVAGNGRRALHAALAVFLDWEVRRDKFSPEDEIAVVFFSEPISRYRVQIREVNRIGNEIDIRYELAPSESRQSYTNFAVIPLGKLSVGKYNVDIQQLPREQTVAEAKLGRKPLDDEWSREFLCKPFSFHVTE